MAITTATSGAPSIAQSVWQQVKLQQAQRSADQAEATARALQAQAAAAERTADRAQENARSLRVQADQARQVSGRANQSLEAIRSLGQLQVQLGGTYERVAQAQAQRNAAAQPVVNTQGQLTGTQVNVTA